MSEENSPEWTKAGVLEQLERLGTAQPGLQAFLGRDVPAAEIDSVARAIVAEAGGSVGARLGPVSRLARSFAVHADLEVLQRIAQDPRVDSVLPTSISDILPKPFTEKS